VTLSDAERVEVERRAQGVEAGLGADPRELAADVLALLDHVQALEEKPMYGPEGRWAELRAERDALARASEAADAVLRWLVENETAAMDRIPTSLWRRLRIESQALAASTPEIAPEGKR
jgi:hypothetical protein